MAEIDSTHDMATEEEKLRAEFERWRDEHGQYWRAGGGNHEKSFAYAAWRPQAARIARLDAANKEWHDKTDWLQKDIKTKELGKHRADVLRERIAKLEAQAQALRDDAERYLWLRDESDLAAGWHGGIALAGFAKTEKHKQELDCAIDAARAAKG